LVLKTSISLTIGKRKFISLSVRPSGFFFKICIIAYKRSLKDQTAYLKVLIETRCRVQATFGHPDASAGTDHVSAALGTLQLCPLLVIIAFHFTEANGGSVPQGVDVSEDAFL
jgi:hypothetical protein